MYILTPFGSLERYAEGPGADVWRTPDAARTWDEAICRVEAKKRVAQAAQLNARLARLAATGQLRSPDMMNAEGEGIYAVKTTGGLRAYGWFGQVCGKRAFVISHVILKKRQKLDPGDRIRATRCRDQVAAALKASNIETRG